MVRPNTRILLVDQNQDARFELRRLAQKAGIEIAGESGLGTEAVSTAAEGKPDAIICGMSKPPERAMQTMELLQDILPHTPIIAYGFAQDVDNVRRAMLAGARDFIVMPASPVRIAESLRVVLASEARRRDRLSGETQSRGARGFVVTVFAAKGGVGKTTVSTNLAVALCGRKGESVVLVDCDDSFGDVAAMLDVPPQPNLLDFIRNTEQTAGDEMVDRITKHPSGLYVVPAPTEPLQWRSVTPESVRQVVAMMSRRFDVVIIDTGAMLSEITLAALGESDLVLWLTSSDYTSVNNSLLGLDALGQLSYPRERIRLVLNTTSADISVSQTKIEAALGEKFWWRIPYDAELRTGAQTGQPAVLARDKARGAESIRELAGTLMGETTTPEATGRSGFGRFIPRRRKGSSPPATGSEVQDGIAS